MLKIRYDVETGILSGWEDNADAFDTLQPRQGERTTSLDMPKPDADDYEDFKFENGQLRNSPKPKERNLFAELDGLKERVEELEKK